MARTKSEQPPEIHPASHDPPKSSGKLALVAALTGAFMLVELAGGVISGSLALLSDAGHMFVDFSGLMLASWAARVARKPADPKRTFGYRRAEVLGAFVNGGLLVGLVLFITWESLPRLFGQHRVDGGTMLWIAVAGLVFNLAAGAILVRGLKRGGEAGKDINLRGALLNVASDALGSAGAVGAALLVLAFGWHKADAIASLAIAALIAFNAVKLVRETLGILLQSVPGHLKLDAIMAAVRDVKGVRSVHDPHVWAMAPGDETLTLHVVLDNTAALARWDEILVDINRVLAERFDLHHNIIQPELHIEEHPEIKHV